MYFSSAALGRSGGVKPGQIEHARPVNAGGSSAAGGSVVMRCPGEKRRRERLRAMASDTVAAWRSGGLPPAVRTAAGLREVADTLVRRGAAGPEHVGWMMVTIVSEYWRQRLAAAPSGRRLLLLPDCPAAAARRGGAARAGEVPAAGDMPLVCGPSCGIATIWAGARDSGWVVEPVSRAVAGIGSLLTGQYDGVLGVARLRDLEKAFAMLPAFSLPVAAVPFDPGAVGVDADVDAGEWPVAGERPRCAEALAAAAIDVEWVLGLLGVAGGGSAPVGDYLPLLREAAELFAPARLATLGERLALGPAAGVAIGPEIGPDIGALLGDFASAVEVSSPLDATAAMAGEYLTRGGKFLRPVICLAAHEAVRADRGGVTTADTRPAAEAAAVAIEVFHKASLVHDDIEDADRMRYGRATLHMERGTPTAINVGDYLLGVGYRIVAGLPGVDPAAVRDVLAILADAHVRLARGQGAELWWREREEKRLTPSEALAIYGLKTSPAFEAAVAMGIRLAGLRPAEAGAIGEYALHVGTGFQVLNDLKDWSGDLENDRRAAGDLLGGRPTVMWALAVDRLAADDVCRLRSLAAAAGRPDAGEDDVAAAVAEARGLYARADVVARAAEIVSDQRARAAVAASTCRLGRLRDVLEFLLELAVPESSPAVFSG